jgi:hypothetical protein
MANRSVSERVAMTITRHKTRDVFDRYHIVNPGDFKATAAKIADPFTGSSAHRKEKTTSAAS